MSYSPIILFTYNRPHETQQTIESLKANSLAKDSILYIFSDAAKTDAQKGKVDEVRHVIDSVTGFKEVIVYKSGKNKGLAKSVIDGVTAVLEKHGSAIVLEDDLVTSPNFLSYMNQALDFYRNNPEIISISGCTFKVDIPDNYEYDVYFTHRMSSYGWGTWLDRWEKIDWEMKDYPAFKYNLLENLKFMKGGQDLPRMLSAYMKGKIHSWAVRFAYHQYKTNTYTVYPIESKVNNIGFDSKGTNTTRKKKYDVVDFRLSNNENFRFSENIFIDKKINKSFLKKYKIINRILANYIFR